MCTRPQLRIAALVMALLPAAIWAQERAPGPAFQASQHLARAEAALREQEPALAESEYRAAAAVALNALALLDLQQEQFDAALQSLQEASQAVAEPRQSVLHLALAHMRRGHAEDALPVLRQYMTDYTADFAARTLLAHALNALGKTDEASWEFKDALQSSPDNPELLYALASSQLALRQVPEATFHFDRLKKLRPLPATHVLIGRTYRDFGYYREAEAELLQALKLDRRARRAHYYLGTIYLQNEGEKGLQYAPPEFEQELRLAPNDYLTNLYLGISRVALREHAAAVLPLRRAVRIAPEESAPQFFLGQAYHFLRNFPAAVGTLREAIRLSAGDTPDPDRLGNAHYLLAQSLRELGQEQSALPHFTRAQELKAQKRRSEQERMRRFLVNEKPLAGEMGSPVATSGGENRSSAGPKHGLAAKRLRSQLRTMAAQAYFNLATLHARQQRFARAAGLFQQAARWDAELPDVQYSLGLAHYNAQQYAQAVPALERALQADAANRRAARLLGLSYFHSEQYPKAASLLAADPESESDSGLRYALAVSLARSGRAAEAGAIFAEMLRSPSTSPDLLVLIGQIHAQQQDFESARGFFRRALELDPETRDAHYSLGQMELRGGRLAEAESEFQQEVRLQPQDARARYHLAFVLELQQRQDEALRLLEEVLRTQPSYADARYLTGKILIDQGQPGKAVEQLEAAVQLAPEQPHMRYQLAQAYQKVGRNQEAEQEFARFREIKQKQEPR
ncbi:MAG: tetratricopeptide repeat protein [Terriglobales bacterium]